MEAFPYTLYDNRADIDHNALQLNLVVKNKTIVTNINGHLIDAVRVLMKYVKMM